MKSYPYKNLYTNAHSTFIRIVDYNPNVHQQVDG